MTRSKIRTRVFRPGAALFAAVLLGVTACGGGVDSPAADEEEPAAADEGGGEEASTTDAGYPEYYPDDYGDIVEGSRDENSVVVYSVMGEEDWEPMLSGFNELYPWIEVQTLDLGTAEVFERYYAEQATGSGSADMLLTLSPGGWARFIERDGPLEYDSPEEEHLPDWANEHEGIFYMSADPFALVVNEQLLAEGDSKPQSLAEVADLVANDFDYYNGKITTYGVEDQPAIWQHVLDHMGDDLWDALEIIGPAARPESSGGAMGEKMASGEYAIALYAPYSTIPRGTEDFITLDIMTDGTVFMARGYSIAADADSPNSSKLLTDYMLSADGQQQVPLMQRVPYREDVFEAVEAAGHPHYNTLLNAMDESSLIIGGRPDEAFMAEGVHSELIEGYNRAVFDR